MIRVSKFELDLLIFGFSLAVGVVLGILLNYWSYPSAESTGIGLFVSVVIFVILVLFENVRSGSAYHKRRKIF